MQHSLHPLGFGICVFIFHWLKTFFQYPFDFLFDPRMVPEYGVQFPHLREFSHWKSSFIPLQSPKPALNDLDLKFVKTCFEISHVIYPEEYFVCA